MLLDRQQILRLLRELGDRLERDGVRAEMFVVGGAAMALAFNNRRATRDIDAIFEPKTVVYEAAARLAEDTSNELDEGWLNDAVKGLLPGDDPNSTVAFDHPGLTVRVASPEYLFAMKVAASRVERDASDIAYLYRVCGYTSVAEALDAVATLYPHLTLEPRSQFLLEELVAGASDGP